MASEYRNLGVPGIRRATINVDIGNIGAGGELTVNVAAVVEAADRIIGYTVPEGLNAGVYVRVPPFVQALGNIRMVMRNETAGAIDPAAADWEFFILEG